MLREARQIEWWSLKEILTTQSSCRPESATYSCCPEQPLAACSWTGLSCPDSLARSIFRRWEPMRYCLTLLLDLVTRGQDFSGLQCENHGLHWQSAMQPLCVFWSSLASWLSYLWSWGRYQHLLDSFLRRVWHGWVWPWRAHSGSVSHTWLQSVEKVEHSRCTVILYRMKMDMNTHLLKCRTLTWLMLELCAPNPQLTDQSPFLFAVWHCKGFGARQVILPSLEVCFPYSQK